MREGADLPRRTAGRRLARKRERTVAGLGDFSRQEMDVVDKIVAPHAAGVLVETHGPEADDLGLRVGIKFGQRLKPVQRHARHFRRLLQRVVGDEFGVFVKTHVGGVVGLGRARRLLLQGVVGPEPIADVGLSALEHRVGRHELLVDPVRLDDVVGDGVEDEEIGVRIEDDADIGEVERAVLEGREHGHPNMRRRKSAIGHARPQDRVHLRHVGAPQHEGVCRLDVVIAARGLVDAEGAHHACHGRGHAVTRIRIDIVGAETRLEKF
jgi:hypothetical protein